MNKETVFRSNLTIYLIWPKKYTITYLYHTCGSNLNYELPISHIHISFLLNVTIKLEI